MDPLHVYIHWPFCKSKCPYCDFNSHVRNNINEEDWLNGYLKEIDYFSDIIKTRSIKTIFFGGGTPSLMSEKTIESIINKLNSISPFQNIEITIEANPTSSELKKFKNFKSAGINRISIGVQSLIEKDLNFLGRNHSSIEAIKTIEEASTVFDNYSFDLIYARPNQTTKEWEVELKDSLKYVKNHISLYQLAIEKGTQFYSDFRKKKFSIPNQEQALELYDLTNNIIKDYGLSRYEISNYSLKGKESEHNLGYWKYREYLGIGAGAHSKVKIDGKLHHIMMIHNPEKWIESVNSHSHGVQKKEEMLASDIALEYLLMGLRLEEGISIDGFKKIAQKDLFEYISHNKINFFEKNNFLNYNGNILNLTDSGKLVLNHIVSAISL
ncbi:MAG: radical SAM family heme chaperone HemW [Alphaproteobacteria bacterium]|nr:radical SAM family heme chaperone HemW [Alphaproteobacteria bacterium]